MCLIKGRISTAVNHLFRTALLTLPLADPPGICQQHSVIENRLRSRSPAIPMTKASEIGMPFSPYHGGRPCDFNTVFFVACEDALVFGGSLVGAGFLLASLRPSMISLPSNAWSA
jgi:hypothetical protein